MTTDSAYQSLPSDIRRLFECIMARAHDELERVDPDYVRVMDEVYRLDQVNLVHSKTPPTGTPTPSSRLSKTWHRTLEALLDLYLSIQTLETNVDLLSDAPASKDRPTGVLVNYHLAVWWPNAQAVVEKAQVLGKRAIRSAGLSKDLRKNAEDALKSPLTSLQKRLERRRDPDLHGGRGTLFEAITEDDLWESIVALRAAPSVTVDGIYDEAKRRGPGRARYTRANTDAILEDVANSLGLVADIIGCPDDPPALRDSMGDLR